MNALDLCNEILRAELPYGTFIVGGSGPLWVRELTPVYDADVLVSGTTFYTMIDRGWAVLPFTWKSRIGEMYLRRGNIELYTALLERRYLDVTDTLDVLLQRADIINNVPFLSIDDTIRLKRRITHLHPKHWTHVQLLQERILQC